MKTHKIIGIINENTLDDFLYFIEKNKRARKLEIYLYSNGGSGEAAFAIHDFMKCSKIKFTVTCIGRVESAALVILAGGDLKKAYMNTVFMHHRPVINGGGFWDNFKHRSKLSIFTKSYQSIIPVKVKNKQEYMDVERAKQVGFIDEIITKPK